MGDPHFWLKIVAAIAVSGLVMLAFEQFLAKMHKQKQDRLNAR